MPRSFNPEGKDPRYPRDRMPGGPQARFGLYEEVKTLDTDGLEVRSFGHPAGRQSLYRLLYRGSDEYFICEVKKTCDDS
jgi:hypothetical protein